MQPGRCGIVLQFCLQWRRRRLVLTRIPSEFERLKSTAVCNTKSIMVYVPFNNCLANSKTATILVLGFHSVSRNMPRHIVPLFGGESLETLGW